MHQPRTTLLTGVLALPILAGALTGCGSGSGADPQAAPGQDDKQAVTEVWQNYAAAFAAKNYDGVCAVSNPASLQKPLEQTSQQLGHPVACPELIGIADNDGSESKKYPGAHVDSVDVTGDKAVVHYTGGDDNGQQTPQDNQVERVNGRWLID